MFQNLLIILALLVVVVFGGLTACSAAGSAQAAAVLAKIDTVVQAALPVAAKLGSEAAQAYVTANASKYGLSAEEIAAVDSGIAALATSLASTNATAATATTASAASDAKAVAGKGDPRFDTQASKAFVKAQAREKLKL